MTGKRGCGCPFAVGCLTLIAALAGVSGWLVWGLLG